MLIGYTLSNLGSWFRSIAVIGLIYAYTQSAMAVGGSFIVRFLPRVIMNFVSGAVVDHFSKKKLMVFANGFAFLADLILFLSIGHVSLIFIYAMLFFLSAADALYNPARMAIIPELFAEKSKYSKASAQLRIARESTMLISTALGGILIALAGLKNIFLIDGISYLLSGLFHLSMRVADGQKSAEVRSLRGELRLMKTNIQSGLIELGRHRVLKVIVGTFSVRNFTYGIAQIAYTMIIFQKFHLGETWLGWSYMFGGVGAIIGGTFIQRYLSKKPLQSHTALKIVNTNNIINAIALLLMFVSPAVWPFMVMVLVHDVATVSTEVVLESATITFAPKEVTGRISSLFLTFGEGAFFIGSLLYTFVLQQVNLDLLGIAISLVMFLGGLLLYASFKNDVVEEVLIEQTGQRDERSSAL